MTEGIHRTSLQRLRLIGFAEGASFIVLLGIAMPLKYFADMPLAVRIVGSLHGGLFLLYLVAIGLAVRAKAWPPSGIPTLVVASLLPFGPFLVDGKIREQERALQSAQPGS